MAARWMLKTHGDTLGTVQQFLVDLFRNAKLDSMLIPARVGDPPTVEQQIAHNPAALAGADPFAPIMKTNAASLIMEYVQANPQKQLGAVLRSCELRSLLEVAKRQPLDLAPILLIGVECVGTFPAEDLAWRKGVDQLTDETLQFARQGGINAYRYRPACQMCTIATPADANVTIQLLGLPARKVILIAADDDVLAGDLHLDQIASEHASPNLIAQHERMVGLVTERRARARERAKHALYTDLAMDVDNLIRHLKGCAPCRACLDACVIYRSEAALHELSEPLARETVVNWLTSCVGCGMCEAACPQHLPLATIFTRIHQELQEVLA